MIEIIVGTIIVVLFYRNMRKNQAKRLREYQATEEHYRQINERLDKLNDR